MLLTSIQIQGFKSFADKTVLKFGRGVTAVVGPNGSGKSNISDAVRWVLGEQSTKSLRGQSMEDVIFGGTADRKPHGFCQVTLNIDNADRELNFDNDFVSVTRRYYRSHESEYLINGNVVRLKDIHELFMDTGLGRDGYSMIGQGKIDSIIGSKSQERRDIFEEAAGISRYRYRKTDAERKLASTKDNLLRLSDIMNELEDRIGPLAEQSKKAEKFIKLAEAKRELEIGLWVSILENAKLNLRNQDDKISIAQSHYNEIENKILSLDELSEKNSADFARFTAEIDDRRKRISSYTESIAKISGDISVLNNNISHNNEIIESLKNEIDLIKSSSEESVKEIAEKRNLAETKRIESESVLNSISELEKQLSELLLTSDDISRKIADDVLLLNDISSKISDASVEKMSSNAAVEELTLRSDSIATSTIKLKDDETAYLNELAEAEKELKNLNEEATSLKNALNGYKMRYEARVTKSDELKKELESIRLDIEAQKRKVHILEELEKNLDGFNHSVKSIIKENEYGKLHGIYGPVIRLISVDKKYSVAIETALGNATQNIIVDNENTAKSAIEFLKKSTAGRATFLPVSSIKSREFKESGFENEYGFICIASDLVETKSEFSEIIKYLLGGTVVVKDVGCAISIAKKFKYRFKIVSLDGQVINSGGSITGGSSIKNVGLLSRQTDIQHIYQQINDLCEKEKKLDADYTLSLSQTSKCENEMRACEDNIRKVSEDIIRTEGEYRRTNELCETVKRQFNDLNRESAEIIDKIALLKANVAASEDVLAKATKEKIAIEARINRLTGGRNDLITEREKITSQITEYKLIIVEYNKDIENLLSTAAALEINSSNRMEKIADINKQISEKYADTQLLNNEIDELNRNIEDLKNACETFENEITDFSSRRDITEKSTADIRINEKEYTLEREKINAELARLSERRENMVRECDNVIRQLFDEYQLTKTEAEATGIRVENAVEAKKSLAEIKGKIRALGNVNVSAIEEYKEVYERYTFMKEQISDVESAMNDLKVLIANLTEQMKDLFITGFNKIGENFSKVFTDLFGGGSAKLVLTEPDNILESGIDIIVKLPGKNVPSLDGLSGGEKALIALAIYFAIMRVNAPPFCFLDEVDTALDDINVDRFADYMSRSDFATQFICITHRRGTMEAADMLYGVTMQEKGISKLLELNVAELEKQLNLDNGR